MSRLPPDPAATRMSKRDKLAGVFQRIGVHWLLEALPQRDCLIVLNYHRIGWPAEAVGDPGVFSATPTEFDQQIAILADRYRIVSLDEALRFVEGGLRGREARVLITFDDGYLDNYLIAYPVLKRHAVPATFFLATSFVGSGRMPWWDGLAYLTVTAARKRFTVDYPRPRQFDLIENDASEVLRELLAIYKSPSTADPNRFYDAVCEGAGVDPNAWTQRIFLDWNEAREMLNGGMQFGSHTHTHPILSKLSFEQQMAEVERSKSILEAELSSSIATLAYPVGHKTSFNHETREALRRTGYEAAFSYYGGVNSPASANPYDLRRGSVDLDLSTPLLRLRVATAGRFGKELI